MNDSLSRLVRDPFLHFLLLGGALFLAFRLAGEPEAAPVQERIVISQDVRDRLAEGFRATWRRPPSEIELDALVESFVKEEVLYREALALGLDRDDAVVRQRLAQKMGFILDAGSELAEPTEAELAAFVAERADRYRIPPRISFEQIFLGEAATAQEAAAMRDALASDPEAWREMGRPTLLPPGLEAEPPRTVNDLFGGTFFEAAAALEPGAWDGPVRSAYGPHLVRVTAFEPGREATLDTARAAALRDWRIAQSEAMEDARYRALLARYEVVTAPEGGAE